MGNLGEKATGPPSSELYAQELGILKELFKDVDPTKAQLVDGLIEDAAFLRAQNIVLRRTLEESGMVLVHPNNKTLQKPVEAAKQYLKNVNSYATVIKTLNGVLNKNIVEEDDGLEEFE
jgi:regulator of replication initiation timing